MHRRDFFSLLVGDQSAANRKAIVRSPDGKVRVSLVRDTKTTDFSQDDLKVEALVRRLIQVQYDVADIAEVFAQKFQPHDRVGIKVNCLSGRRMSSHLAITTTLIKTLNKIGIPNSQIYVWERLTSDLRGGGYPVQNNGKGPVFAGCDVLGYDSELTIYRSIGSFFAKPVSSLCTATINVPVLKDHGIVGVTLGMKNMFGAIHNPNKYHHNFGDPYVADLYSHPNISGKIRMTIIDALDVQPEGGPPFQADWCESYGGLLISDDPVALDRYGWKMIEEMRTEKGLPSLKDAGREPTYIHTAATLGLGTDDLEQIDLRES